LGLNFATVKLLEVTAVVTLAILTGVAFKVYVPFVFTIRFENVATPLLSETDVVLVVKVVTGSPAGRLIVTDPLVAVARFP
jgi:chemotaxis protein CheY-P-specific phosphatase CheC